MKVLITGGAGFIGTNLAESLLGEKYNVTILDNFSRRGTNENIKFLLKKYPKLSVIKQDVRNFSEVKKAVGKCEIIFHLAGQVAVTTSILNPRDDFESNLLGTINILEAARSLKHKPFVAYSSTNKVYGKLDDKLKHKGKRYISVNYPKGISENEPLDFYSPYGCSKGSADQYVRDYFRIFDLPTVVFRQSCIYGTHQYGIEDQGWVAHFLIKAVGDKPITIFGNGFQIRDVLYVSDLIKAYKAAMINPNKVAGQIFNIGGGINNTASLLEMIDLLQTVLNKKIKVNFKPARPGDQAYYVSNTSKIEESLKWKPNIGISQGLSNLHQWVLENLDSVKQLA